MAISGERQHQRHLERVRMRYAADQGRGAREVSAETVRAFRALIRWSRTVAERRFAWRGKRSPYRVLVAEVMLQQTQAPRVEEKFREFILRFPTLRALADAPTSEVLRAWQGLGYNRRGLALHRAANMILTNYRGRVPREKALLCALPGIGEYTASAIRTFAFNLPEIVLETNIRTVFTHCFFSEREQVPDSLLVPLIERTVDTKDPATWYDALMDYGALLKGQGVRINHKNPTYRPQERFEGSRRALRGAVIRAVSAEEQVSLARLKRECAGDARFESVVSALLTEGLVAKTGRSLRLA